MQEVSLPADDPRAIMAQQPVSWRQGIGIAICFAINALDGFDILAVTFVAPGIAKDWQLGPGAIGMVVSAGLIGMVVGSLFLGQLADRIGRQPQILLCLAIMAGGMLASALATHIVTLSILRGVTGLGLGAMLASTSAMTAELANRRRRDLAVSIMAIGYPVGGVVGGWIAAQLLRDHGWQSVFFFGAGATAAMIPIVLLLLPESIWWLADRRGESALPRINRILRGFGHPPAGEVAALHAPKAALSSVLTGALRRTTIVLTILYALHMMTFYYALGWTPTLVASLGFDASRATLVSVVMNIGGMTGGVVLGAASARFGLRPLLIAGLFGAAIAVAAFGAVPADFTLLRVAAFMLGFLANGTVVAMYALIAGLYPASLRATGIGAVIGIGRLGAAIGPFVAGQMLALGAGRTITSMILALGSGVAAILLITISPRPPVVGEEKG